MATRRRPQDTAGRFREPAPRPEGSMDFPLPLETAPMEAKSAERLPGGATAWQYEPKWDGFRCLAFKGGKKVDLRANHRFFALEDAMRLVDHSE